MEPALRRPFCWCVVWFLVGTGIPAHAGPDGLWMAALLGALGVTLLSVRLSVLRRPAVAVALLCVGSVLARGAELRTHVPDALGLHVATRGARPVVLRGVVEPRMRLEADGSRVRAGLRVQAAKVDGVWRPYTGRTWWTWYRPAQELEAGLAVEVTGRLRQARGFQNPGLFDYGAYLRGRGYHSLFSASGANAVTVIGHGELPAWQAAVGRVRRHVATAVQHIPASPAGRGYLLAVVAGDRQWVSAAVQDASRATGTYHLLSISGLHVGIVAAVVLLTLRATRVPRRWTTALVVTSLVTYAFVTGGAVPVVRATLMFSIALALLRLRRAPDGLSIIAVVALVVAVVDPLAFRAAGTQLSFGAVAGLLLVYRPASRWLYDAVSARVRPAWRWPVLGVAHALLVPAIVHVAIAPVLLWHFHRVPLVSIPANTLATPLLSVVLVAGGLAVGAGSVHPLLGVLPGYLAAGAAEALLAWIRLMAKVAHVVHGPAAFPPPAVVAAYAAVLAIAWFVLRHRPWWRAGTVVAGLAMLTVPPPQRPPRALEIIALDVGQADATLLRFPTGEVMLVDGGRRSRTFDTGDAIVLPYLLRAGVRRLDWVVATHGDNDHMGGLISILEVLPVGEVWTNGTTHNTWTARTFRQTLGRRGHREVRVERGHSIRVGEAVQVRVLNPPHESYRGTGNDENNNSIVLRVDYANVAVLLTADVSRPLEAAIAAGAPWPERVVVKAPHHGYPRPGTHMAVAALEPVVAWASLGAVYPERRHLAGLAGAHSAWRTDRHGAVRIRIAPNGTITVRPTAGEARSIGPPGIMLVRNMRREP